MFPSMKDTVLINSVIEAVLCFHPRMRLFYFLGTEGTMHMRKEIRELDLAWTSQSQNIKIMF